jgi:hypothetical protein
MQVPFVNTKSHHPRCAWNCQLFSGNLGDRPNSPEKVSLYGTERVYSQVIYCAIVGSLQPISPGVSFGNYLEKFSLVFRNSIQSF